MSVDARDVDAPDVDATVVVDAPPPPPVDAAIDSAPPQGLCDPLAPAGQQGCLAGQKCTWITVQDTPELLGELGCVPDGSVGFGGACVSGPVGETTGYDDCAAGLICVSGECRDICGFDGSQSAQCATSYNCTRYTTLFSNGFDDPPYGVCNAGCDPLTQLQVNGQGCGAGMGCYVLTDQTRTIAVCAAAGTAQIGQTGVAYANSCIPGAQPRLNGPNGVAECGGLCRMVDVTSTLNTASEGGMSPDSCSERWGVAPPSDTLSGESCRYWWAREPFTGLSPYSNTLGWCFKHTVFQYDSDLNGTPDAPFPRCVNLTTDDVVPPIGNPPHNDARYFWCLTEPSMLTGAIVGVKRAVAAREPRLDRLTGWR